MLDLANSLQESLTLLRVITVIVASVIGFAFMVADLIGAISALGTGTDFIDPPYLQEAIIVIVSFTCVSNAIECFIQGSIMPIVTGLLINFALMVIGSYLANIAQNLGCLLGLIATLLVPLITLSVHATLLKTFLNQCGSDCYRALSDYPPLSTFINWISQFSLI